MLGGGIPAKRLLSLIIFSEIYFFLFTKDGGEEEHGRFKQANYFQVLRADAKGVAGLGKAGGDGSGGSDKSGQQVPPEVYIALTYAGTAFLFTLSVPLILYGLNKLLNKVEDCFGCGPSSKKRRKKLGAEESKVKGEIKANSMADCESNKQKSQFGLREANNHNSVQSQLLVTNSATTTASNNLYLNTNGNGLSHPIKQQPFASHLSKAPPLEQSSAGNHGLHPNPLGLSGMNQNSNGVISLPLDVEGLNYKTSPMQQKQEQQLDCHNQNIQEPKQQPYIISSPYL